MVRFEVLAAVGVGDAVYVVGEASALGRGDVAVAVRLDEDARAESWWRSSEVEVDDSADGVSFRILARSAGGEPRFLHPGDLRFKDLAGPGVHVLNVKLGGAKVFKSRWVEFELPVDSRGRLSYLQPLRLLAGPTPALVIIPGGGYRFVSSEKEGFAIAEWLRRRASPPSSWSTVWPR